MAVAGFARRLGSRRLPSSFAASFLGRSRCFSVNTGVTAELASLQTEVELRSALQEAVACIRMEREAARNSNDQLQDLQRVLKFVEEQRATAEHVTAQLGLLRQQFQELSSALQEEQAEAKRVEAKLKRLQAQWDSRNEWLKDCFLWSFCCLYLCGLVLWTLALLLVPVANEVFLCCTSAALNQP
eukprot:EG_transcript_25637